MRERLEMREKQIDETRLSYMNPLVQLSFDYHHAHLKDDQRRDGLYLYHISAMQWDSIDQVQCHCRNMI